jgi:lipopolysaccharide biosynthesis regulator YciM
MENFEIPKSQQMRMTTEIWQYCCEVAKSQGFRNPTEAAKQIIKAHKGWTTLRSEEPRR